MRRPTILALSLAAALLGLSGCMQTPADYSPNYSYVSVESERHPGRVKKVLAPDACLGPSEEEDVDREGEAPRRLPPGCANAYALQRMTERERDLVKGRPLGKAPAVVSARAAQKVLNKEGTPLAGANEQGGGNGPGGGDTLEEPTTSSAPTAKAKP